MRRAMRSTQTQLAKNRQSGARIQIGSFDSEAARRKSVFDHGSKFLHAAAFVIVNDLQDTHYRFTRRSLELFAAEIQLNDTP